MAGKTLTKAAVVSAIYERLDHKGGMVKATLETLLRLMKQAIKQDNQLLISGFGKFEAYAKQARKGRNPQTGDSLLLPPRRACS